MSRRTLVLFPKGTLNKEQEMRLLSNGYLAIQVDDPTKIVVVPDERYLVSGNTLAMSAMKAMSGPGNQSTRAEFAENLYEALCAESPEPSRNVFRVTVNTKA